MTKLINKNIKDDIYKIQLKWQALFLARPELVKSKLNPQEAFVIRESLQGAKSFNFGHITANAAPVVSRLNSKLKAAGFKHGLVYDKDAPPKTARYRWAFEDCFIKACGIFEIYPKFYLYCDDLEQGGDGYQWALLCAVPIDGTREAVAEVINENIGGDYTDWLNDIRFDLPDFVFKIHDGYVGRAFRLQRVYQ